MTEKIRIKKEDLLLLANEKMQSHDAFIEGMNVDQVEEKADVLVFRGDFFLDSNGLPTEKTTMVFNIHKFLALTLSKFYTLE